MEAFRVRPLSEGDLDEVISNAGGFKAHPDADQRQVVGADYRLGSSLIELKMLDDEGLSKVSRQKKIAELFHPTKSSRSVVVLDRANLPQAKQREFDRIIEGPIKQCVRKASKLLKQSRIEVQSIKCSVLFIINNGYATISHDQLIQLVSHRIRNDTSEIDTVVVAGAYYHTDGFDGYFLWPIECIPIKITNPFKEFEALREAWNNLSEKFMTDVVLGKFEAGPIKEPVNDTEFEYKNVTYVKPALVLGEPSSFYIHGRPRQNDHGFSKIPVVGTTFPDICHEDWLDLHDRFRAYSECFEVFEFWEKEKIAALNASTQLRPTVLVRVRTKDWLDWCKKRDTPTDLPRSFFEYANWVFSEEVRSRALKARELRCLTVKPSRYILAITEIIGQNCKNDVSHIVSVRETRIEEPMLVSLVEDARIHHEHALTLAAAYAYRDGLEMVCWEKDVTYAWI